MLSKKSEKRLWELTCFVFVVGSIAFMAWCLYDTSMKAPNPDPVMTTQEYSALVIEKRMMEDER